MHAYRRGSRNRGAASIVQDRSILVIELPRPDPVLADKASTPCQGRWVDVPFMLPDHEILFRVVNQALVDGVRHEFIEQFTDRCNSIVFH